MNKQKWIYVIVGLVVLVILSVYLLNQRQSSKNVFASVEQGTIIEAVYGIGKVVANKSYQYKTGVPTTITQIFVKEGQEVSKKSPLLELDGMTKVSSPLEGTLTTLNYKVGENTVPNAVVLIVTDLKDLYLLVNLEQQGALKVKKDQQVRINFESMRERTFIGTVSSIYSDAKDFLVHIEVQDLPSNVLPGMTADVAIVIQEKKDSLIVPFASVKNSKIKILKDSGEIEERTIEMGLIDGEKVEVLNSNLKTGEKLLLSEGP
ncbi:MAG TPA: HlyD family efflux transporter periplasmic adaptor subunit [Pseudobdellovibrionaceae bacterium]|nr:HlyD family efflux transporter periplasmic adaptor subunit [Pseudobdellovibrionaceae bacterium]